MNAAKVALCVASLLAGDAYACSCIFDPDVSPRWLFAQFDAVVELEIGETTAVAPGLQQARLRIRRSWLDPSQQGRQLTIQHHHGLNSCGASELYTGSIWISVVDAEHHPGMHLGGCGLGRKRQVDDRQAERFDRYQHEFLIRRSLAAADWARILQPLRKLAASWVGVGPADSCQALLEDAELPGDCPRRLAAADGAFWAISEDWQSEEPMVYAFATAGAGESAMWQMPLEVKADQLHLKESELRHQTCDWLALSADLHEVCRNDAVAGEGSTEPRP